jgi:hypothetical protein
MPLVPWVEKARNTKHKTAIIRLDISNQNIGPSRNLGGVSPLLSACLRTIYSHDKYRSNGNKTG